MGMNIMANVKGKGKILDWAPQQPFINNVNSAANNTPVYFDFDKDDPYYEMYKQTTPYGPDPYVPGFRLTTPRRLFLQDAAGMRFDKAAQSFTPEEVKVMAAQVAEMWQIGPGASRLFYGTTADDLLSTIEFFQICADNDFYITIA